MITLAVGKGLFKLIDREKREVLPVEAYFISGY
jgi:hypothetical protein